MAHLIKIGKKALLWRKEIIRLGMKEKCKLGGKVGQVGRL